MRNIHLIPTDKPSRLFFNKIENKFVLDYDFEDTIKEDWFQDYHIYITIDGDIFENDYIITKDGRLVQVSYILSKDVDGASKVILTSDQDLIDDGVQPITNTFAEWFVKNPTCEYLHLGYYSENGTKMYSPIIPSNDVEEEKKVITLEDLKDFDVWKSWKNDEVELEPSYTIKEVNHLLTRQRGNCYIAVLTHCRDEETAKSALNALEPFDWRNDKV